LAETQLHTGGVLRVPTCIGSFSAVKPVLLLGKRKQRRFDVENQVACRTLTAHGHRMPSNWPLSVTESVVLAPMKGSITVPHCEQVLAPGDLHPKIKWLVVIAFGALVAATPSAAEPNVQAGQAFAQANCSHCHSIDKVTQSTLAIAPPFRTLHERYPVESLEEALAEGIMTGHPSMPEFKLDPGQIGDLIAYLKSLEK
jgi:mono/diheme cytochrome c family protein